MRRRDFIKVIAGSAAAWPLAAQAQQAERMRRLGVLMAVAESDADARKGIGILQDRLQTLGRKDGNNIRIDYRWGNGNPDRIQDLAKELVAHIVAILPAEFLKSVLQNTDPLASISIAFGDRH